MTDNPMRLTETGSMSQVMSRKPVNPVAADGLLHWIWDELPSYAQCYMEPTLTNADAEAAGNLVFAAPNDWRGLIALCAYWIGLPNPAYREIIDSVWNHDHHHLLKAARGGAPMVRRMFSAARFCIPLAGQVTVYRGAFGVPPEVAARGLAWTTARDVACWFACRQGRDDRSLVISATVNASDLLYWSNDRQEHEVIPRRPLPFTIDGRLSEWKKVADDLNEQRNKLSHANKIDGQPHASC